MTTVEKAVELTRRPWFIAVYRLSVIMLVPATTAFCGWLVWTVYTSQLALADLRGKIDAVDSKVERVTVRVDGIDNSFDAAEKERQQRRDRFAEQAAQVASRLSALETGQSLMIKQIDRLITILDKESK